jgi:outer membrane beta-barrel protein
MKAQRTRTTRQIPWALLLCAAASLVPARARAGEPAPGAPADSMATPVPAVHPDSAAVPAFAAPAAPTRMSTASAPAHAVANAPLATVHRVRLTGRPRTVLRSGPSDGDAIAGVFPPGTSFVELGTNGDWVNVRLSPTESGWVHASLCSEYEDLSGVKMSPNPRLYTRTGSFVLEGYAAGYAFDRESNSLALGGRLAYYVFDRLLFETGAAWTHVHRPAEIVESLFGLSLEADDFDMLFYHLNATFEFLPGRQMVPFVTGGAGASIMQGRTETSVNFGAGTTLFLSKRSGMRWEARDYVFHSGTDNARRLHHNIEFSIGSLLLF